MSPRRGRLTSATRTGAGSARRVGGVPGDECARHVARADLRERGQIGLASHLHLGAAAARDERLRAAADTRLDGVDERILPGGVIELEPVLLLAEFGLEAHDLVARGIVRGR